MKNFRAIGLLVLSLVIGIAAAVYAAGWVSQQGQIASNKVVMAATDIELGSKILPNMISVVDWPSGVVPAGTFKESKDLQDRVAKTSLVKGEAILEGKLAPPGTKGGLSAVIAEGKRAMTVRVNDVVGVAGFALPGNYVDVMVSAIQDKVKGEEGKQISKTVLEHVLVLAVAQEAGRDDTKPKVVSAVTLELSLQDSEKLDLARSVGSLSLVLRNQMDKATVATAGITKQELFGEAAPVPQPPALAIAVAGPVAVRRKAATVPFVPRPQVCVEVVKNGGRGYDCFDMLY